MKLFLLDVGEKDMRFSKVRLKLQRFSSCADYFWARLFRRTSEKDRAEVVKSICQTNVSRRKCRIHLDRAVEITNTFLEASPTVAFVVSKTAFQVALINFRRNRTRCRKPLLSFPVAVTRTF